MQVRLSVEGQKMDAGYSMERPPHFSFFLSHGKEGVVDGERYKQTPEIVDAWERLIPAFDAKEKDLAFIRWDQLTRADNPEVVIFFARPEVMSGLFIFANFNKGDPNGVICPMGAGCNSIPDYLRLEQQTENPKVVLGMSDRRLRPALRAARYADDGIPYEAVFEDGRVHGGEFPHHEDVGDREEED
jgi:hypothetical protein